MIQSPRHLLPQRVVIRRNRALQYSRRRLSHQPPHDEEEIAHCAQQIPKLADYGDSLHQLAATLDPTSRQAILHFVRNAEKNLVVPEPSWDDLKAVALNTAIPFVGFGVMDNAILIVAGDAIDTSLGVLLGISTMCAAAIGNIVSDVAGILLGTVIEDACAKYLKLPQPVLSNAQRQLRSVRWASQFGCGVGIVIGCIIGMFPLLFIDSNKIQARKREAAMDAIFQDVIHEAGSLIGATRTCLFLVVDDETDSKVPNPDGNMLYAKYEGVSGSASAAKARSIPLGQGILSRAALTREAWNIYDVHSEPDFVPELVGGDSEEVKAMLCVPVLDSQGRTIAVIRAINKKEGKGNKSRNHGVFTNADVQILKALATHISVSLQRMYEEGDSEELRLKDTIQMLKDYGLSGMEKQAFGRRPLFPEDSAEAPK